MLKIRLSMGGVRKRPIYKIVVADSRFPRDGRFVEKLGSFNPLLPKDKKEADYNELLNWLKNVLKVDLANSNIMEGFLANNIISLDCLKKLFLPLY